MTYIKNIDGKWYAFEYSEKHEQVYSIGRDNPPSENGRGRWCGRPTDSGIKYVSSPSPSRKAAYSKAYRWGEYGGEW